MHTFVIQERTGHGVVGDGDVRMFRNSDASGDAELQWSEGINVRRVTIPGWVAAAIQWAIEDAAGDVP